MLLLKEKIDQADQMVCYDTEYLRVHRSIISDDVKR